MPRRGSSSCRITNQIGTLKLNETWNVSIEEKGKIYDTEELDSNKKVLKHLWSQVWVENGWVP